MQGFFTAGLFGFWKRFNNFVNIVTSHRSQIKSFNNIKGTSMQIEKVLINDRLRVSKVSGKFRTPTIYNFAVIH